jgi:membrane fusion protein, copper/silver efflux system
MDEPGPSPERDELPEGEEQAPPGTRAMALVRWGLVVLMAFAAAGAWVHHASSSGVHSAARDRFHCPMHPSVVMEHEGECPICGMDLVPFDEASAPPVRTASAERPAPAPAGRASRFTCPMHLAFVTEDPKARCPDCGMKLVPAGSGADVDASGGPVLGLADVDLTQDRIQLSGLRTAVAAREPLSTTIRTVGFVTATERGLVSVTARFSGWIESLGVGETGQLVEKGAVLAAVYSPEMLSAQQVFLNAVRWSGERRPGSTPSSASPSGPASDLERDARQRLELLGIAAEDVRAIQESGQTQRAVSLRAPARGYIARKNAVRGVYVQPGSELFQIADLSTVWVLADVYESEIGRVKVGQQAQLELAAWPGESFPGRVTFIYPALNTGSRTLQARIELRNPGLKLRPGMYGDVALALDAAEAVTVPRNALVDTGELQYVFVSKGQGRFSPRRVRAGWSGDGKVAILEGLEPGERVVTTANFLLDSESRLRAALDGGGAR